LALALAPLALFGSLMLAPVPSSPPGGIDGGRTVSCAGLAALRAWPGVAGVVGLPPLEQRWQLPRAAPNVATPAMAMVWSLVRMIAS